ncbi:MAG: hypothetical protein IJY04_06820 [Clostridia bacterium]|nr:hypothetical protein [Clostridia bacterium]
MKKRILCLLLTVLLVTCLCSCECEHEYDSQCDMSCNRCSALRESESLVDHRMGKWVSRGDATCGRDGTKYRSCRYCGELEEAVEEGTALEHQYTDWWYNKDFTHTEDGTKTSLCIFCRKKGETCIAEGTAGHNFWETVCGRTYMGKKCKSCGWEEPELSSTNMFIYESFERRDPNGPYRVSIRDDDARLMLYTWTKKTGIDFSVAPIEGFGYTNIRALRVRRDAVSEEADNDAIVDILRVDGITLPYFPKRLIWEFDLMLGSENASDIYLSSRKKAGEEWKYNIFLQYEAEAKQLRLGETVIASDIAADEWYNIKLYIDDVERCYRICINGEQVTADVGYQNSAYPSAEEQRYPEFYRFTAMKGLETVDFYLDNISISIWE